MLRRRLSFLLVIPLLCAVPTAGRRSEAYFSLSTTDTFLPGDKVSIRLSSSGVNALEFRVYKVNDPAAFFERLGDAHNFGHLTPKENITAPTPIERFHDWKHHIWVSIRNFFREQFSGDSREKIREAQGRNANPDTAGGGGPAAQPPTADPFASPSLLNKAAASLS